MNKKKKSTNTSPYPDEVIDRLARAFYPAILACWNSEEGQREFAAWQAEQAHLAGKEKQEAPNGELPAFTYRVWIFQGASGWTHPVFALLLIFQHVAFSYVLQILLYSSELSFKIGFSYSGSFIVAVIIFPSVSYSHIDSAITQKGNFRIHVGKANGHIECDKTQI